MARSRFTIQGTLVGGSIVLLVLTSPNRTGEIDRPFQEFLARSAPPTYLPAVARDLPDGFETPLKAFGALPLSFEPNVGQAPAGVQFIARGRGYTIALAPGKTFLTMRQSGAEMATLQLKLAGAGQDDLAPFDQLPGVANYFIGRDPQGWRSAVPTYARVRQRNVWPGIDAVYYGNQQQLEFDFVVAPGAEPAPIAIQVEGANTVDVDSSGDVALRLADGREGLRLQRPVAFQEEMNGKRLVDVRFVRRDDGRIAFDLGDYDRSRALVIDPVLSYSTYLGGLGGEFGADIVLDASGYVYVAGSTELLSVPFFPTQPDAGGGDAFVAKLDPTGSSLIYSTHLGGQYADSASGIALDAAGAAYVTGTTYSRDFPVTAGAFDDECAGDLRAFGRSFGCYADAFVAKLSSSGSSLVYSTYLGGGSGSVDENGRPIISDFDFGAAVAVDATGNAVVVGSSIGYEFPTTSAAFQTTPPGGRSNAFVTKVNAGGSGVLFSTYLGGHIPLAEYDFHAAHDVAIDGTGNIYVGGTAFGGFPTTASALQQSYHGGSFQGGDGFVSALDPTGATLLYSTFLGGAAEEVVTALEIDSAGDVYATGWTASSDFPVTAASFDTTCGAAGTCNVGARDAFVARLDASVSTLRYSTFLGGGGDDAGHGLAVASTGIVLVTGETRSSDFPTVLAMQPVIGNINTAVSQDAFVTKVAASGTGLLYSTFLGGSVDDFGSNIVVDAAGLAYVVGTAASADFPTTAGAFQRTTGGRSAFVSKIDFDTIAADLDVLMGIGANEVIGFAVAGYAFEYHTTVRNRGPDPATDVIVTITLPAGVTVNSIAPTQGSCSGTTTITCTIGNLSNQSSAVVVIGVMPTVHGETVTATATVTSNEPDPDPANNTYADAEPVRGIGDLALTASASPDPGTLSEVLTYTVTATNLGPDSTSGVRLFDLLPSGVNRLAISTTQGSCLWALHGPICDLGTLAGGASAVLMLKIEPSVSGALENSFSVGAAFDGAFDPDLSNNTATTVTTVLTPAPANADLSVAVSVTPEPVDLGGLLTAQIVVANHGPSAANGIVVDIPNGGDAAPAPGMCFAVLGAPPSQRCYLGTLASGGQTIIALGIHSGPIGWSTGSVSTAASVRGNVADPQPANNSAAIISTVLIDARAAPAIPGRLVMDPASLTGAFATIGTQSASEGSALILDDQSGSAIVGVIGTYPSVADGTDLVVSFQVRGATPVGDDGVFSFVLNDGSGAARAVIARGVVINGQRGVALWDGSTYGAFIPIDWAQPTTLRIRLTQDGLAQIVEKNGTPLIPPHTHHAAGRTRSGPTVELLTGGDSLVNIELSTLMAEQAPPSTPNAQSGFGPAAVYAAGSFPAALTTGDLTGDGKLDLIMPGEGSGAVTVLPGDGHGAFGTPLQVLIGQSPVTPPDRVIADFNGDGRADLAVADWYEHNVSVQLGEAGGSLGMPRTFPVRAIGPLGVAAGDLNADGRLDLAVSNYHSRLVSVLFGDGAGGFGRATNFPAGGLALRGIAVADMTGDGRLDVVVANEGTHTVAILPGDGSGGLGAPVHVDAGVQPGPVAIGDFDANGQPDIAVVNALGVGVLLQGTTPLPAIPVDQAPFAVAAGDLNGDGTPDFIAASNVSLSVVKSSGPGSFEPPASTRIEFPSPYPTEPPIPILVHAGAAMGDLNEDRRLDVVFGAAFGVMTMLGNGDGSFGAPVAAAPFLTGESTIASVAVADMNADRHLDVAAAMHVDLPIAHESRISLRAGDGIGSFAPAASFSAGGLLPRAIRLADLNGDTRPDVVVVNEESNNIAVLLANERGSYGAPQMHAVGVQPSAAAVRDLNRDGFLDIAVANSGDSTVSILKGSSAGTFGAAESYTTGLFPLAIAIADVDGNGTLDVVTANGVANTLSLLRGAGDGTLGEPEHRRVDARAPVSLVVEDLNADGLIDAAVADFLSDSISFVLSLGSSPGKVAQAAVTITGPASATYGQTGLSVVGGGGSGTGAISYSAGESTACTVNTTTGALAITSGSGTCEITATKAGDTAYEPASALLTLTIGQKALTVTAIDTSKIYGGATPTFDVAYSGFVSGDGPAQLGGGLVLTFAGVPPTLYGPSSAEPVDAGIYSMSPSGLTSANYAIHFKPGTFRILYSAGTCLGDAGHTILPPIRTDGSSVFKAKSTVPAKFRVCDANGSAVSAPVVASFRLATVTGASSSEVNEIVDSTTPDSAFRWSAPDRLWIFNISTMPLSANKKYWYEIQLKDGTSILFQYSLK